MMRVVPLVTKTRLPPVQPGYVERQRLLEKIAARPQARLILVCAPAGYGKSSLLVAWCHHLLAQNVGTAWYALDDGDNDPARFNAHLLITCRRLLPESEADGLPDAPGADVDACVTEVINALAGSAGRFALAFDDYHLITQPAIHHGMALLLEHLPKNVQVIIGTRADPPLQLSRLRARDQLVELRSADLRFSRSEVGELCKDALALTLSPTSVDEIEAVSEGWAAALRLVALALKQSPNPGDEAGVRAALARFSAGQQHIFDYFAQEVFALQTPALQAFLLDICVLKQFDAAVCRALSGNSASPLLLDQLQRSGLFVIPLSEEMTTFRFHHLFEEFLRKRLQLLDAERYRARHHQAAEWHEAHGGIADSVNHALSAEAYAYAARLIETKAWETLSASGEIVTLLGWLPAFPESELRCHPRLCLCFSRALYLTGDLGQSTRYVEAAEQALANVSGGSAEIDALRGVIYSYRATLAAYQGSLSEGFAWAERAQHCRAALDPLGEVRLVNTVGFLHFLKGESASAARGYEEARDLALHMEHHYLVTDATFYLAQIDWAAGRLAQARQRCKPLLTGDAAPTPPLSALMVAVARVDYEQNRALQAEAHLRSAVQLARRGSVPDVVWMAASLLAVLLGVQGRAAEASTYLQQAEQVVCRYQSVMMRSVLDATRARVMLAARQMDKAAAWAQAYQQIEEPEFRRTFEQITLARVFLACRQPELALPLLDREIREADSDGRLGHVIEAETLRSLAYAASDNVRRALGSLERALCLAQPEGYVRTFLDEGTAMLGLLRHAVETGIVPDYAAYLLETAHSAQHPIHPADLLSEREIEVLRLLAGGATNQDVADRLVISLGTVKSHINHVMNKLDARNRTEAAAKARSLGLLAD